LSFFRWNDGGRREARVIRKRWVSRQVPRQTKQSQREAKKVEAQLLEDVDRGQHRGDRGSPAQSARRRVRHAVRGR
jgi:hypothetical protein